MLRRLRDDWDALAVEDAMWAVLADAEKLGNRWQVEAFFESGRQEFRWLACELDRLGVELGDDQALDFGCGLGRVTQAMANHFRNVIGVDISEQMLRRAEALNRFEQHCVYKLNATADLACLDNQRFDLIYSTIVLQHMPWAIARSYLAEMAKRLQPTGVLAFQLPSRRLTHPPVWKRICPRPVKALRRRMASRRRAGRMQMHTTPEPGVTRYLQSLNLKVHATLPNRSAGRDYESFFYVAQPIPPA